MDNEQELNKITTAGELADWLNKHRDADLLFTFLDVSADQHDIDEVYTSDVDAPDALNGTAVAFDKDYNSVIFRMVVGSGSNDIKD